MFLIDKLGILNYLVIVSGTALLAFLISLLVLSIKKRREKEAEAEREAQQEPKKIIN